MANPELNCLASDGDTVRPVLCARPDTLESVLDGLSPEQAGFVRGSGFRGRSGQLALIPGSEGVAAAVLGLGEDTSPFPHGSLPFALPEGTAWRLEPGAFDMAGAVLGFCLGAYQFTRFKPASRAPALLAGTSAFSEALLLARAAWFARDLINLPANHLGPAELAAATRAMAERFGAVVGIIEGAELAREYPAVAAVGAGSERPPAVARFAWRGSGANERSPLISLCGKGV